MNENQIYQVCLEDYALPRYAANYNCYYGTMADMDTLVAALQGNNETKIRYAQTISALKGYRLDSNLTHNVAGIELPILKPVEQVCCKSFQLEEQQWIYSCVSGGCCGVKAKAVTLDQVLYREGNDLFRCVKASFEELQVSVPGLGWYRPGSWVKGFPGMIRKSENRLSMTMYLQMQSYTLAQQSVATADTTEWHSDDLEEACRDIIGEI